MLGRDRVAEVGRETRPSAQTAVRMRVLEVGRDGTRFFPSPAPVNSRCFDPEPERWAVSCEATLCSELTSLLSRGDEFGEIFTIVGESGATIAIMEPACIRGERAALVWSCTVSTCDLLEECNPCAR